MEDISDSPSSGTPSPRRSSSRRRAEANSTSTSPKHVKSLIIAMLKMKPFIGKYKATVRVDRLGDYRDVIEIEERDSLIKIISDLQWRIRQAYPECWPGISIPGDLASVDGHCFWVEHADKLFELHHYRIADIKFEHGEVAFVIKAEAKVVPDISDTERSVYDTLNSSMDAIQEQSVKFARGAWELLTVENLKNTATFLGALIALLGTAGVYLLDYLIRLIQALTGFTKVSMPAILKTLDILQKCIGAVFVFFAMMWRDIMVVLFPRRQSYVPNRPRHLNYR